MRSTFLAWSLLLVAALTVACEPAETTTIAEDDDGDVRKEPRRKQRRRGEISALPLGDIRIDAPLEEGGPYRINWDTLVQVLSLISMRALPVTEVENGYRIDEIEDGSVFALAGLEKRDVVTHVNGIPILEADAMRKAYAFTSENKRVALTLRRKGETTSKTYSMTTRPRTAPTRREAPSRRPSSKRTRSKRDAPEAFASGVREVAPHRYEIKEAALAALTRDPDDLLRTCRLVPEREDDEDIGVRLFGIRSKSVPSVLGFKNGDRIRKINGVRVTGLASALAAYEALDRTKKTVVELVRKGQPLTLEYTVVP